MGNDNNNATWDLTDLFLGIDDPKIDLSLHKIEKDIQLLIRRYKNKVSLIDIKQINNAYIKIEKILSAIYEISQYASLLYSKNTSSNEIKQFKQRIEYIASGFYNKILFFDLEIGLLPKEKYDKIIKSNTIGNYVNYIKKTYKRSTHKLSEPEEKIANLKDLTGASAFKKLYTDLVSSFEFSFEIDGKIEKINGTKLRAFRYHKDKNVRRRSMKTFFAKYEENALVITHIYNAILKNEYMESDLRKYKSAINIMNVENELDDEVVENLIAMTTKSYQLVSRYYKIKSKLLNIDRMTLSDIHAPLFKVNKEYSWLEAKEIVLSSFASFDNEFFKMAKLMFDENRIDSFVTKYKTSGAFCSASSPEKKPYVLLNFLGRYKDISTIAHELGHSIHDMFASKQTLINYYPVLPIAETASVFSEMIVTDKLLKEERDKTIRKAILTDKLEDIFSTSHRQNMFSKFEILNHTKIAKKAFIPHEEFCASYEKEIKLMFGDAILFTDEYKWEWSSIPHIFEVPFYVYSYNFANLLVIAIYQQYLEQGTSFVPKLKEFLRMGSVKSSYDIISILGIDIRDKSFWDKGFVYIESLISNLEQLIDAK